MAYMTVKVDTMICHGVNLDKNLLMRLKMGMGGPLRLPREIRLIQNKSTRKTWVRRHAPLGLPYN